MLPHEIVARLEQEGVRLSVRKGRLFGSRGMTEAQRAIVTENKLALIAVLTHQCPTCNQVLRVKDCEGYLYLECVSDPAHYSELRNKRPGKPMGFFSNMPRRECEGCGKAGLTYIGRCVECIEETAS